MSAFEQSGTLCGLPEQDGVLNTNPLSQAVMNQEQFLANPHHG
jgi:hypothetical protein